jgi:hypothetical protein
MSNIFDENPNEMELDLAAPAENLEEEAQAMPVISEEGGEDASGDTSSSGGSGSGGSI